MQVKDNEWFCRVFVSFLIFCRQRENFRKEFAKILCYLQTLLICFPFLCFHWSEIGIATTG